MERESGNEVGDGSMINAKWFTFYEENSREEKSEHINKNL